MKEEENKDPCIAVLSGWGRKADCGWAGMGCILRGYIDGITWGRYRTARKNADMEEEKEIRSTATASFLLTHCISGAALEGGLTRMEGASLL